MLIPKPVSCGRCVGENNLWFDPVINMRIQSEMSVRELRAHLFPRRAADTTLDPVVVSFRRMLIERNATEGWGYTSEVPIAVWFELIQLALIKGGFLRASDREMASFEPKRDGPSL